MAIHSLPLNDTAGYIYEPIANGVLVLLYEGDDGLDVATALGRCMEQWGAVYMVFFDAEVMLAGTYNATDYEGQACARVLEGKEEWERFRGLVEAKVLEEFPRLRGVVELVCTADRKIVYGRQGTNVLAFSGHFDLQLKQI